MNDNQRSTQDLRCSTYARLQRIDPVGSAGAYDEYVLIRRPLPWPRDITGSAEVVHALEQIDKASRPDGWRCRPQFVWDPITKFGAASMIRYRRSSSETFAGFTRTEVVGTSECSSEPGRRDVLLCAHGKRDRCCGSLGGRTLADLDEIDASTTLWRSSHLGGHRFAPTALILPEGSSWAFLDAELLQGVARRSLEVDRAVEHYRGCVGLDTPELQVLDREGFRHFGWGWLDAARSSLRAGRSASGRRRSVSLMFVMPDGTTGLLEGEVRERRRVLTPDCGFDPGPAETSKMASKPEYWVASTTVKISLSANDARRDVNEP